MSDQPTDSPTPDTLSAEERRSALDTARRLAELGIPIFVAPPAPNSSTGFQLPNEWQKTVPDPTVVDRWQPGWALCAVMGSGLDLIDIDPRNGGNESLSQITVPATYLMASTPSGGWHYFIASLGTGTRDKTYPGIDVKGGREDADSRGFAFLAPTEKPSKDPENLGTVVPYRWYGPAHFDALAELLAGRETDTSGAALAMRVRELKTWVPKARPLPANPTPLQQWANEVAPHGFDAAERAMADKLAAVRDWDPAGSYGFRQVLMRAALTMGGYVAADLIDEDTARERLREAVENVWPQPDENDELWITQGLTDGGMRPFAVYTRDQELEWEAAQRSWEDNQRAQIEIQRYGAPVATAGPGLPDPHGNGTPGPAATGVPDSPASPPPNRITRWIGEHLFDPEGDSSDQGQAEAVLERMYPALRYATDAGVWVEREAEVWTERKTTAGMAGWAVSTVARLMPLGSTPVPKELELRTPEHWRAVRRAAYLSSAGTAKITSKISSLVAGSDHPVALKLADLDTRPEVLWAGGMPWDLRASREVPTLAAIDPNTPHLHTASCAPVPGETPYWDAFLAAVFPDPELRAWAVRVLSVALTGYADAVLPILYDQGQGRTGKSSVVDLLVDLLGTYGIAANPKLLAANDSSHDAIVYQLKGARLAFIDEGPRAGHLAAERLKQLSGGARLTAAQKGANPITFRPTHTMVLTANGAPPLTDPALLARMRLVPCNSPEEVVRPARLPLADPRIWEVERPGILATLMTECAAWLEDRATAAAGAAPDWARADVEDEEAAQNPVIRWVELCTVASDPGTLVGDLYSGFLAWFEVQPGMRRATPPSQVGFGMALTKLGYPSKKIREGTKTYNYRPLSILGGGGFGPPTPPPAASHGPGLNYPAPPPNVAPAPAEPQQGPSGGVPSTPGTEFPVGTEHGTTQNPRSTPSSSSSVLSVPCKRENRESASSSHPEEVTENTGEQETGNDTDQVGTRNRTSADQQVLVFPGEDAGQHTPRHSEGLPEGLPAPLSADQAKQESQASDLGIQKCAPEGLPEGLPEGFDPLGPITMPQKKAWAFAVGCTVPEASEALKLIKKQAKEAAKREALSVKVAELSGREYTLPVAVNRACEITEISTDEICPLVGMCWEQAGGELTVDMETTGYPVGHRDYALKTVQLGWEKLTLVLDPHDPVQYGAVRWAVAAAPVLVAHSGQADLVALAYDDLGDFEAMMAKLKDTAIEARLVDPKITGSDGGLKDISVRVLGDGAVTKATEAARKELFAGGGWLTNTEVDTPITRSGWAQASKTGATMIRYAGADVLDTAAISKALPGIPDWLREREHTTHHMTARVTFRGQPLDAEKIRALTAHHVPARAALAAQVTTFPGTVIENPGSDRQVAVALQALGAALPRTEKGNPQVAAHVLTRLRDDHPDTAPGELARLMLEWRHHDTALGTFLGPYATLVEHGDGRVRPTIYTVGTDTGRMSSVRPNIQQLPREGGVRSMVLADPGYVFVSADFSGVELRGAAALSADPAMLHMITEEDEGRFDGFHWQVARQAFDPEATKAHRYTAKRGVFGCVPLDTKILTQRGWLTHDQVQVGDKTPGRRSDGTVCWTPITGVHVYDDAPLMRATTGGWSATTTPGHRWASTRRRDGGARGRYTQDEWTTTETITGEHTVHLAGLFDEPGTLIITPDEAALVGWAITDGSVYFAPITGRTAQGADGRRRKALVKLYQAKPEGVRAIRKLLADLGLNAGVRELPVAHKRTMLAYQWLMPAEPMRELFGRAGLLDETGFVRERLEAFVLGLSTAARLAFLDAVIAAEGSMHGSAPMISQNAGPTADAIELAGYLSGYRVTRSVNDRRGNAINYKLRLAKPYVTGQRLQREDAGRAPVWCVSTGLGTWTMRHEGQIMLTGNTFYGGGAERLAQQVGVRVEDMRAIRTQLKGLAPHYFRWSEWLQGQVRAGHTQYPSYSGRIIHFPGDTPHKAPAYAIQGTCRELLVDALMRWRDTPWSTCTVIPVHDELIVQVPAEDAHAATVELVRCMEGTLTGPTGAQVKIIADPGKPDPTTGLFTGSPFWEDSV